jgi:hypothetical protein
MFPNNNFIFYHQLKKLIIILYIDNIHYIGKSLNEIKKLEELLIKIFKMSNLDDSKVYLGIDINYNQSQQICHFNQSNYIKKIIDKYSYNDLKIRKIPIKIDFRIIKFKKQAINAEIRNYEARVNILNFLIYQTRSDISNAISIVDQYNINSDQSH